MSSHRGCRHRREGNPHSGGYHAHARGANMVGENRSPRGGYLLRGSTRSRGSNRGRASGHHGQRTQVPTEYENHSFSLHADIPERFRRGRSVQPGDPSNEPQSSSMNLNKYFANLHNYFQTAAGTGDSKTWNCTPEMPEAEELAPTGDASEGFGINSDEYNVIDRPWESKSQYLQTQYKLLREDALGPLRDALSTVFENPTIVEADSDGTQIYDDVHVRGLTFTTRGIAVRVSFSLRRVEKQIQWKQSKRLLSGSLVALLPANKPTPKCLVMAVVAARPLDGLEKEQPHVDLYFARSEDLVIDIKEKWLMVQAREGFFEAQRHTLVALQQMERESFPLKENIVRLQQDSTSPEYLAGKPSINELIQLITPDLIDLGDERTTDLTNKLRSTMDDSQLEALQRILSKKLALVQGPPGTGKTYVSTQALDIVLSNMNESDPPVVVACQTNHALDQILRHIAKLQPDCFVRLGGRSKDTEVVGKRSLYEIRIATKKIRNPTLSTARRTLKGLMEKIQTQLAPFQKGSGFLTLEYLSEIGLLSDEQCESIRKNTRKWVSAEESHPETNELRAWVGRELRRFELSTFRCDFPEVEAEELELEELNEIEAENAVSNDDDEFSLTGDFFEIFDDWTGGEALYESVAQLMTEDDLGEITESQRGALYNYLARRAKEIATAQLRVLAAAYTKETEKYRIGRLAEDAAIIDQSKIVGVTTTGFSKYRPLISAVKPKIVLIEEAAEILEAPVTATCVNSVQQLILVGDHKQLRPRCQYAKLEGNPYNMNISLFERLVNNQIDFTQLKRQRRMIYGVRRLLQPIYGTTIEDHPVVKSKAERPPVSGMGKKSTWFYTHRSPEEKDSQRSFYNTEEVAMIVEFISYLLSHGLPAKHITVLTFYNGQKRKLTIALDRRLKGVARDIQIATVDSYQGEENGVIILSLVRNNSRNSVGFVSVANRVCVALSRAQRGLYIFGNADLLCGTSELWSQVLAIMQGSGRHSDNRIGSLLPLYCEAHDQKTWISNSHDWENYDGGCDTPCKVSMACGHRCELLCHPGKDHDCKNQHGKPEISQGRQEASSGEARAEPTTHSHRNQDDGGAPCFCHECFPETAPQLPSNKGKW